MWWWNWERSWLIPALQTHTHETEEEEDKGELSSCLTLAVVDAVNSVVVRGGPGLVEGGACVAEGGVWRIVVVDTGVPGVGMIRLLHLDWEAHRRTAVTLTHACLLHHTHLPPSSHTPASFNTHLIPSHTLASLGSV